MSNIADPDFNGDPTGDFSTPAPETIPASDVARSEEFKDYLDGNAKYVPEEKKWFVWQDNNQWERDANGWMRFSATAFTNALFDGLENITDPKEKASAVRLIESGRSLRALDAMTTLAASDPSMQISVNEWDNNPWILGVQNGVLDLKTGAFRAAVKEDYVLRKCGCSYDPAAKCPRFDAFMEQVLPDQEVREFVIRTLGYSLTGSTIQQMLFFFYGQGANGKSTLVEVIQTLLGDYSWKADASLFLKRKQEGESQLKFGPLKGRRFVIGSEVEDGAELAAGRVKDLTGGDTMQGRLQYGLAFQFAPTHKLWFYGNTKPVINDPSNGIWRRLCLIPFNVKIPEGQRDLHIVDNLCAELPGILNKLLAGCLEWQTAGAKPPASVMAAVAAYKDDEDSVAEFIQQECALDPKARTHRGTLYLAYSQWSEANGNRYVYRDRRFFERLRHFPGVTDMDPGTNTPLRGSVRDAQGIERFIRPFKGIRLLDPAAY